MSVTGRTRVFAVLGDPVSHSLSPPMHNAAFREAGLDAVYVALRCGLESVAGLVRSLALAGGGGNVTLPHKLALIGAADEVLPAVRRTGAGNTFWSEGGRVLVDNTDVEGFRRALGTFRPEPPDRVLLLGAGGAARACAAALLDGGVGRLVVANRSEERARALRSALDDPRLEVVGLGAVAGLDADLLVNATSLGLDPSDPPPVELERLGDVGGVFDLVYGPGTTPLVAAARAGGIPATDGREMLVQQGAAAFERWWGREAPLDAMRGALSGEGAP